MQVQIIFNNESLNKQYRIGWGISCFVDGRILFDTGEVPEPLLANMKKMNVDINAIEKIVISHDHWDHTGGLWEILKANSNVEVYACPNFSKGFKEKVKKSRAELIEADDFIEISKDIFVTGEIPGDYHGISMPEEALVVKTKNGISMITGCAHPGIVNMAKVVRKKFPRERFYFIFGGFHLMDKDKNFIENTAKSLKDIGFKKAGPTHCTGKEAEEIFKNIYKDNFIEVKSGQILEV